MKRKKFSLCFVVVIVMFIAFFLAFKKARQNHRLAQLGSTIRAIDAALSLELDKGNANIEEIIFPHTQQWRILSAEEYDRVITELVKFHNLDAKWDPPNPLVDLWANRLVIKYRKLPDHAYQIIVISKGRDGILGTEDDISR